MLALVLLFGVAGGIAPAAGGPLSQAPAAKDGYRILINVGDRESDLAGGWAERSYKLPNPIYFIL